MAWTLLTCLLPMIGIISLTLLVFQGRPIFYRQFRPGLHGALFQIIKFRTMHDIDLAKTAPHDSSRVTPIGRFLRMWSLDELPQLWNIGLGHMSFVGPRPLLEEYLPLYSSRHAKRHAVRPGLTGLAQVSGRKLLGWREKLSYDVFYVENVSLFLDLQILFRSFGVVLSPSSEFEGPSVQNGSPPTSHS